MLTFTICRHILMLLAWYEHACQEKQNSSVLTHQATLIRCQHCSRFDLTKRKRVHVQNIPEISTNPAFRLKCSHPPVCKLNLCQRGPVFAPSKRARIEALLSHENGGKNELCTRFLHSHGPFLSGRVGFNSRTQTIFVTSSLI